MKKILFVLFFTSCSVLILLAQEENNEKERMKMSGQLILMTTTNSNLTGGYFHYMPAVRGLVTASKGGFSFTAGRNSDLVEPKSAANVSLLIPAYTKSFGKFATTLSTEVYIFDQFTNMDVIAPSITLARKGALNVDVFVAYGWAFQGVGGNDMFTQRLTVSTDYAGFTFKLIGWNVDYGTHRNAAAFEVSTKLSEKIRLFVSGNINHVHDDKKTHKFGLVRLAYTF